MAGLLKRNKLTGILFSGLIVYFTNLYFLKCWPATKGPPEIDWNDIEHDKWAIPLKTGLVEARPPQRRKNYKTTEYPPKKTFASVFATKGTSKIIWKNRKKLKTTILQSGIPLRTRLVKASPSERRKNFKNTEYPPKKIFPSEFATKGTLRINWKNKKKLKRTISQSGILLRAGQGEASPSERRKNFKTTEYLPKKTFANEFATKGTSKIIWKNKKKVKSSILQSGIPLRTALVEASPLERQKDFKTTEYPPKKTSASEFATNETSKIIWKNMKQVKTTISQRGFPLTTGLVEVSPSERKKNFKTTGYPPKKTFANEFARKGTSRKNWKNMKKLKTTISLRTGLVAESPTERRRNFTTTEYPPEKTIASGFATKGTSKIIWKNMKQVNKTISPSGIPLRTGLVETSPLERRNNFTPTEHPPTKTFASEFSTKGTSKIIWKNKKQAKTTISQSSIPLRTRLVEASPLERRNNFTTTEYPPTKTFASEFARKGTSKIIWKNMKQVKTTISQSGIPLRTGLVEQSPTERRRNFTTTEYPPKKTIASEFPTKGTSKIIWKNVKQVNTTISPSGISLGTGQVEASPSERRRNFTTTEYPPKKTFASEFATKRTSKIVNNKKQVKTTISQSGIPLRAGLVEARPSERRKNFKNTEYPPKKTFASEFAAKGTSKIIWKNLKQVKTTISQSGISLRTALVEASPSERRKSFTATEYPPKKAFASEFAAKGTSKIVNNKKQVKMTTSPSAIPLRTGLVEARPSERRKNFTTTEYPPKKTFASEVARKGTSKIVNNKKQVKTAISQSGNHLKIARNLTFKAVLQKNETRSCAHRINVMDGGIVLFRNITMRSKLGRARVLETYLEQPAAEDEFFKLEKGFFTLYCVGNVKDAKERLHSAEKYHALRKWVTAFEATNPSVSVLLGMKQSFHSGQYLAIERIEYANVYWTIIDLLDIFITTQRLGIEPEKLNIVLMDAHPPSSLDSFWSVLFQRLIKLGTDDIFKQSNNVMFENLVWRYPRVKCPLLDRSTVTPNLILPFRSFVLKRFAVPSGPRLRDCVQKKLNVLVIFRRDYQNHPRNLKGIIDRKIANEKDVVDEMENGFPNLNITVAQLDSLPLKRQLELVASADIFFGMHGAAHTFPIFMAPGGAVIEMFNFQSNNWHMKRISTLSGHFHITWINRDVKAYNQTTRSTTIPAGIPSRLLRNAIEHICPHKSRKNWKNIKKLKTTLSQSGIPLRTGLVEESPLERRRNFTTSEYPPKKTISSEFATKGTGTSKIIWKNMKQMNTTISPSGISLGTGLVEASLSELRRNFTTTEYPPTKTFASEFSTKGTSKIIWKNKKQAREYPRDY